MIPKSGCHGMSMRTPGRSRRLPVVGQRHHHLAGGDSDGEAQGQRQALHQAFDLYLVSIFGMRDGGHLHFDSVVDGLPEGYGREILLGVESAARRVCGDVVVTPDRIDNVDTLLPYCTHDKSSHNLCGT